ncbi:DUF1848 domain-containing protein [Christensenellaceae bacterium NSJ-44]|uniref:DUF1848 domain-containing protein n=1 Tax=Luoshenia tenuis TaxID=2763654 RepID=A0A926HM12_9FIRM|nr:DUF1848 domain-containing protein [Luoshenia tenuis]MBC8528648.1 DUF1848 domain-containing protein [Luoshenia tenuis]
MIISASRRTDIPCFYSDWFFERIRAGKVWVRNPVNLHQISEISLSPEVVDGIVFWTKNPTPMLNHLHQLHQYMYYFQFTLNAYASDVEPRLPDKQRVLIPAFQRLSDAVGPERVVWRYDPIFLTRRYTMENHIRCFAALAKRLSLYTKRCTISFLDYYRNTAQNLAGLTLQHFTPAEQRRLAKALGEIAHSYGLEIDACAETLDLEEYGIGRARCIDGELLGRLLACPLAVRKDRNQRLACGCAESIDIGAYNTCPNGCRYCYANYSESLLRANGGQHDPHSPLLTGVPVEGDRVSVKKMYSLREQQMRLTEV